MPNYLMLDHGGVLDGEVAPDMSSVNMQDDLVLEDFEWGGAQVLKNGIQIVHHLNVLVDTFGYEIVFHSKNREADQEKLLKQLQAACAKKNIVFPKIRAMAVFDQDLYLGYRSNQPQITTSNDDNILVAAWGEDDQSGKASVRRALEVALHIEHSDRPNHIVFDDGEPNVTVPISEGYQGYLIGQGTGRKRLDTALQEIVTNARQKAALFVVPSTNIEPPRTQSKVPVFFNHPSKNDPDKKAPLLNHLSDAQQREILKAITLLKKEINSCWPYPNKDRKQDKIDALNKLTEHCQTMDVASAVAKVECDFPSVRQGRISSRTADLLDNLKKEGHPIQISTK